MKIVESILTENRCYTVGTKITPKGLMLHSVGCAQPNASVFVRNWNTPQIDACVHAFIDGNDGTVHQTLPWNHRGWHAGDSANDTHIGVEMCEPAEIEYTSGANFTCYNLPAARATAKRTYEAAVALFAHLCKEHDLDPLADGVIISHSEGAKRGIASGHADPEHLWNQLGMDYTMDGFRAAVAAAMQGTELPQKEEPAGPQKVNVTYRVRTEQHGWLPAVLNLTDYAGWEDSPITGIALEVDKGSVRYRVHTVSGRWLGWITENNTEDHLHGYAGNGEPIDAVQIYYYTPEDIRPYQKAVYRVMGAGRRDYWDWQTDTETDNRMDGYAGTLLGIPLTRLQVEVK